MQAELPSLLRMLYYEVRLQRRDEGERGQNREQAGVLASLDFRQLEPSRHHPMTFEPFLRIFNVVLGFVQKLGILPRIWVIVFVYCLNVPRFKFFKLIDVFDLGNGEERALRQGFHGYLGGEALGRVL